MSIPEASEPEQLQIAIKQNSDRLLRLIRGRLSVGLSRRIDAEDVLQEALLNAATRWEKYTSDPQVSVYVWLRGIVMDRMVDLVRHHTAGMRSVGKEHTPEQFDSQSSLDFAKNLFVHYSTPSESLMARESDEVVAASLECISDRHRNIIMMRFFEKLSVREVAEVLSISVANAKVIQFRALKSFAEQVQTRLSSQTRQK